MAKRKGSPAARPRDRSKVAKEGSEAKRAFENECAQLERDISALQDKSAKISEKRHELEEQLGPLRREEEQVQQSLLAKIKRLEEVKNAQRLDKLPPEVWEKILDDLDENDLFPLALSCRYFRQKQKELVARSRESGPESAKPRLTLKTNLWCKLEKRQPASADYLWLCSEENIPGTSLDRALDDVDRTCLDDRPETQIRCLAAFHGYLPLLQELIESSEELEPEHLSDIADYAGESSILSVSSSSLLWLLTFSLHSARRPTGDLEVAQERGLPLE